MDRDGENNEVNREREVLDYFNTLSVQQRNHIIQMYARYKLYSNVNC